MKTPEQLLCKKNKNWITNFERTKWITKGNFYRIKSINEFGGALIIIDPSIEYYLTKYEKERYFYTTQEIRKQKLKKLNENIDL